MVKFRSSKSLLWVQVPFSSKVFVMWEKNFRLLNNIILKLKSIHLLAFTLYFILFFVKKFFYFKDYSFENNDEKKKTLNNKVLVLYIKDFSSSSILNLLDLFFISLKIKIFKKSNYENIGSIRVSQTSWQFFNAEKKNITNVFVEYLTGLRYLWVLLRYWFIGIILFIVSAYYLLYIRALPINKILFEWILIIMFLYWLISGFVFFIKKYQYSKFTSVIQRFWKRSYILFWLIETGVFLTFFYLTLNASDEPVYMYDQMKLYKTQLFSWRLFIIKIIPVIILIIIGYFLQLSLKWSSFNKQSTLLLLLTLLLIYIVWLEFYQFFHIINFYGNLVWVYDVDEYLWNLEIESRRTRLLNNYIAVCLMAKFWHLIFIFVFWVFFILRVGEINRVRYPLFVANMQNFIILYIMSWLYMVPWLKFTFRRHLSTSYFWFFQNFRSLGIRVFFYDLKLILYSILNMFSWKNTYSTYSLNYNFFYWTFIGINSNYFKNHFIKDYFISVLN